MRIGRYEVVRELGHGGFGILYVGRDVGLGREVALKVLRPEYVVRKPIVDRFLQEARAAAKIDHPGIVTVFECGEATEVGSIYIAMELLRGENLAQRLARGKVPLAMALNITRQVASALAAAHRAGIVHRDLKPDNLFLVPDSAVLGGERVKLLDFGIAKLSDPGWHQSVRTHSMTLLGTPLYMSPEQCKSSANVDARSDVYALGCIVFEMTCGKPPYEGDPGELIAAHQLAPVPSPKARAPDLPDGLDALLRSMLAKMPDDRPTGMEQVEAVLSSIDEEPGEAYATTEPERLRGKTRRIRAPTRQRPSEELTVPTDLVTDPGADLDAAAPPAPRAPMAPSAPSAMDKTVVVPGPGAGVVHTLATIASTYRRMVVAACILAAALLAVVMVRCSSNGAGVAAKRPPVVDAAVVASVVPPPDAQVVVLMPIDAAEVAVATSDGDEAAFGEINRKCADLQLEADWDGLERCAAELAPLNKPKAQAYGDRAAIELRAAKALEQALLLLRTGDPEGALAKLKVIPASASTAQTPSYIDARERALAGVKQSIARTTPPVAAGSGSCAPATLQELRTKAQSLMESSAFAAAETTYEQLMKCDPVALDMAYMAACHAHKFDDARSLFRRISGADRDKFKQICQREGIDPSQP